MNTSLKRCPQCNHPAPLDTPQCANCGRTYRTKFTAPSNQTQVFTPAAEPSPGYAAPAGPVDATERAVAMVWTSIGLLVAVLFGFAATQAFWEGVLSGERETIGLDLVLLLASWAALSFLTMRFRRLYVLQAPVNDPAEVQVRRRRFSVAASGAIGLLLVVALGSAAVKVAAERRAALRAQADAAVAAEEEQRVNEQRRAWQQQMEEEAAAERQRRLPFVPVPNDLPPPISPGPRVGGPGPARLRSGAANL